MTGVADSPQGWDLIPEVSYPSILRISTAGSVDDGKSTLIGRLLLDTGNIYDDHIAALKKRSSKEPGQKIALALLTDGLKAEQEQGITIDVAYRYFSTPRRRFIMADTPGHEQYTRNMATGSSLANITLLLVDARKGILPQTKRHAFIASLLGVPRLLVAINKMDLVDFDAKVFNQICDDFRSFATKLSVREIQFVPVSALDGDNIVEKSDRMPWYNGGSILSHLESVYIGSDENQIDFRFPVQYVIRPNQNYRGYAGQIVSGGVSVGDEIVVLPSMRRSRIRSIDVSAANPAHRTLQSAGVNQSIVITLEDEIDLARGDMIVRALNLPSIKNQFEAMIVWMDEEPMNLSSRYQLMHSTRSAQVIIDSIPYRIDINTLSRIPGVPLSLNEVGRVTLTSTRPLFLDPYHQNRATGNFILIDSESSRTVAAGMVIERHSNEINDLNANIPDSNNSKTNLHSDTSLVSVKERAQRLGQRGVTVWCTGLSGSGKSTLMRIIERRLFDQGALPYRLDGDNLRAGLNIDLSFSAKDRSQNIRRVAEVARLFNDAGLIALCSLISPSAADRSSAREIIGTENFIEIYLDASLEVCESRDPHGLYSKARRGEISNFTGISSPYQPPENPDIILKTDSVSIEECANSLWSYLQNRALVKS